MSALIQSSAGASVEAFAVEGWAPARRGRNIVHDLIDGDIAVTLIAARPRSGQLRLMFHDAANANAAVDLHAGRATFTISHTDADYVAMTYVLDGDARAELQPAGHWAVTIDYQAVT